MPRAAAAAAEQNGLASGPGPRVPRKRVGHLGTLRAAPRRGATGEHVDVASVVLPRADCPQSAWPLVSTRIHGTRPPGMPDDCRATPPLGRRRALEGSVRRLNVLALERFCVRIVWRVGPRTGARRRAPRDHVGQRACRQRRVGGPGSALARSARRGALPRHGAGTAGERLASGPGRQGYPDAPPGRAGHVRPVRVPAQEVLRPMGARQGALARPHPTRLEASHRGRRRRLRRRLRGRRRPVQYLAERDGLDRGLRVRWH
mmetsp:Transcript_22717/g.63400  ORF Transcript_22717/g.63400 Transcript_22717/m.63400 type:complete len:260 (-) Transcript_22717:316-1095(-)